MNKERGILFSAPMVRAILEGRKTQTRRVVKPDPPDHIDRLHNGELSKRFPYPLEDDDGNPCGFGFQDDNNRFWRCPYGQTGSRLWVKETHSFWCHSFESVGVEYAAGGDDKIVEFPNKLGMPSLDVQCRKNIGGGRRKRPSIFMPRWASRITLEIESVRVERLQDITEADARAEGVPADTRDGFSRAAYVTLWESINGKGSWAKNPWVWVIDFRPIKK